jgi:hypothetical protein
MVRILPAAFRFLNRLGTLATQASRKFGLLRIFRTIGAGWRGHDDAVWNDAVFTKKR